MISSKTTKKRSASSQAGQKSKKARLDKPAKSAATSEGKKRSRPVTVAEVDEESDSEQDLDEDAVGDTTLDAEDADAMQVGSKAPKDPNASRESHKVQREVQQQRRAAKPHSSLLVDAKRIWALARQKNIVAAERKKHIAELMDVIRGQVRDVVLKHDASRIVQTVVKHGGQKERDEVAAELKGKYKELAQNKYSKFLVTKLIRLCPSHRASILLEFQGHIIRLLLHREASRVLADAFELYANAYERSLLLRDFYGKEVALFSVTAGSTEDKERAKRGLSGVVDGLEGDRRRRVLTAVKENLVTIFNNPDKGAVTHAIVHRALWEYLVAVEEITDEAEREKLFREIFENCQDVLAEMVHTKDGSRVVREFIVQGTAKDRKHIIKAIKPHVERMCKDDEAQLVLFTALDVIDDTKLTAKSLVADITSHAPTLYANSQGRRALLHLIVPRSRRHFMPAQIVSLAATDGARAKTSRKDAAVRADEVRKAASAPLLAWLAESGAEVSRDTGGSLVVSEVVLFADGDKTAVTQTLLQAAAAPYPSADASAPHPVDLPHTSRIYKTLLQGGHFSQLTKSVEPSPHFSPAAFATAWLDTVGKDTTLALARAGGAFVVAELCERVNTEGSEEERTKLASWFQGSRKEIEGSEVKGKAVLLEKIDALVR